MKRLIPILFAILPLIITGCSVNYTINDFPTKQEFYNHFNNSVREKSITAILQNDSLLALNHGAEIDNDTLYIVRKSLYKRRVKVALAEIRKLRYTGNKDNSVVIFLNRGEQLLVDNIKPGRDSIEFDEIKTANYRDNIIPLAKIKEIDFKNNAAGIFPGIVSGLCVGVIAGAFEFFYHSAITKESNPGPAILQDGAIGILAGGIAGFLLGINYSYQFNTSASL